MSKRAYDKIEEGLTEALEDIRMTHPTRAELVEAMALLPCPFCGCTDIRSGYIRDGRSIWCYGCGASVRAFQPKAQAEAIAAWNRRTPTIPGLPALLDGTARVVPVDLLREALQDLCSPFPRETQVVASLGTGNTSIEKLRALLAASPTP